MTYEWDYEYIDNNRWPGRGPVYDALAWSKHKCDGVCQFIKDKNERIARSRIYEIRRGDSSLLELVVSDVEFMRRDAMRLELHRIFTLLAVAYCQLQDIEFSKCVFPANLYGSRSEVRATRSFWRQMDEHEINELSPTTKRLCNLAGRNQGIFCLDDELKEFSFMGAIDLSLRVPAIPFSRKVEALLLSVNF